MNYLIANWKMQLTETESAEVGRGIVEGLAALGEELKAKVVLCPGPMSLHETAEVIKGTDVALGAQDTFWEDKGAFTGEISPLTLKEFGVEFCIVGHSERRQHFGETDEMVKKKVQALIRHGINPVVCVGEIREERDAGTHFSVVIAQVKAALEGVELAGAQRVIVAYEPRWAIGTGLACSPEDAEEMTHTIREAMIEVLSQDVVLNQCEVLYGGSANAENVADYASVSIINGALVGGAALKPEAFVSMAETVSRVSPQ